jgi:hypothetical protein
LLSISSQAFILFFISFCPYAVLAIPHFLTPLVRNLLNKYDNYHQVKKGRVDESVPLSLGDVAVHLTSLAIAPSATINLGIYLFLFSIFVLR